VATKTSNGTIRGDDMTDTATPILATLVEDYLTGLNETDAGRRAKHIEAAWTAHGHFVDPLLEAQGHAALAAMVENIQTLYPGHRFTRTSGIDTHHGQVRFAWEMRGPDGSLTVSGVDFGELAEDGRFRSIVGFFGELPAVEAG
jgi:hypothetical protein